MMNQKKTGFAEKLQLISTEKAFNLIGILLNDIEQMKVDSKSIRYRLKESFLESSNESSNTISITKLNSTDIERIKDYVKIEEGLARSYKYPCALRTKQAIRYLGKDENDRALQMKVASIFICLGYTKRKKAPYRGKWLIVYLKP